MHTPTTFQPSQASSSWASRLLALLLFVAAGFSASAQTISGPDYIYANVSKNPNGATTSYNALNGTSAMSFNGADLGTYILGGVAGDEQLFFQGGRVTTSEPTLANGNVKFKGAQLYYRIFLQNNAGNTGFSVLDLPEIGNPVLNGNNTTTRVFELNSATTNVDWIASASGAGIYTVDIYLQATYERADGTLLIVKDNRSGANYQATFAVQGNRVNTTTWKGTRSDNWFDPANWSNNVPSATVDAFISYPSPGSTVPYPKIYANGPYQTSLDTSNPLYPYTGETYGNAAVRNLSFGGTSANSRATVELVSGNLLIHGDLRNNFDNIMQDVNTVITFAGTANTDITGGGTFRVVHIAGGGTKTLTGNMRIATELRFGSPLVGGLGNVAVAGGSSTNLVTLQNINGVMANLIGETDGGYVSGLVNAQAVAVLGTPQPFGGIGVTLTFTIGMPGVVSVNRIVGQYYTGANVNNPNSVSIKRSFEITPTNPNTTAGGLSATLVFNYLDNERMSVGSGNTTVSESQLYLAFSNNSTSFSPIGTTAGRDQTSNTVTTTGVTSFAIFTLADTQNPLPVSLVAFSAKRMAENSLITWTTAMERNNRGFEVEVSTDGAKFRSLGFVASNSPNSSKRLDYSFTDMEANKSGIRYYRLHQIDLNGQDDYSPVRAVSFAGAGEGIAALSAYPNPFASDEIKLALQSSEAGQASLRLTDLMGRSVSAQTFTAVKGVTEVSIDQAAQLAAGSYLAQVTSPSGEVKTVRIQKR